MTLKHVLIPALPLAAFIINILFGKAILRTKAHWIALIGVAGSFLCSLSALSGVLSGQIVNEDLFTWITSGSFKVSVGFLIDPLTAVMLIVVNTVSLLVHIYSIGYMHGDKGYYRFFAFLSLFTFSMLMLVMGNNFLQMYFGWEAVGLCSYFLIGFWYYKKSAADAAKKAFIVNRFGDFGFGLGVILIFLTFGSLHYADVFKNPAAFAGQTIMICGHSFNLITVIAILLFCGAVGKSAQLPLHVWLPDAMEGPTPVSALIHAATMVTAGVFMVARTNSIFVLSPTAMAVVAVTGGVTAIFAATIALVQKDIKRIIAYSTVSQLGYMFVACGVGAFSAGIFHLYTHAFFKALLFLGAGSVIHAMEGEQDINMMGGLKKHMPVTYLTMLLASLSISGVPGLSGFFSKDEILWMAYAHGDGVGKFVYLLGAITALLTAFYSFRLIYVTFHGSFRGGHDKEHHLHESPQSMTLPLIALALGAVAAGYVGIPHILGGHDSFAHFLAPVVGEAEAHGSLSQEWFVMISSIVIAITGILAAYYFYIKNTKIPEGIAKTFSPIYKILFNKYYVDEIYDVLIVKPAYWFSGAVINKITDAIVIEGVVNGLPTIVEWFSRRLRKIQTGIVLHYSMFMAAGMFILLILILSKLYTGRF
ncbi:MAG: NADH-quinone oxidoreductase subunit L [Nitrospirae bacterium]|nr:NADH-quinone oxidoreductase subunit L [Nitrospirota bacterium]MBF0533997.1 NADH-quinone oxidoreductase subunit L [Nitrospirota bacterium]MBF0616156.1 NADH-quinone oxidoreductase subunit L [Nitrospirota bacterium]